MQTLELIQWGTKRSIVKLTYTDTNEFEYLLMDNTYLLDLEDLGVIL